MTNWDPNARHRLRDIADELRSYGLIDLLHQTVGEVWRYNVDRYAPGEIGDTSRSLGVTATENVRTLTLRRLGPGRDESLDTRLRASGADNSLLINVPGGVRLRVMKGAAAEQLAEPAWEQWEWSSEVRLDAARSNHQNYIPVGVDDLLHGTVPPEGVASLLGEVFLVWAGGARQPQTAGWLGFPTLDVVPWLAVEPLWWDKPDDIGRTDSTVGPTTDDGGDTFSSRATVEPQVVLKRTQPQREAAHDE